MPATPRLDFDRAPVTTLLAAVAASIEAACLLSELPGDSDLRIDLYNNALGILPRLWTGELWRPFTSSLMHGGLIHAAFNIYWLLVFGPVLEERFGSWRFAGTVVLLGYLSMMPEYVIGSYDLAEPIMIVGLSGLVYGLFGLLWMGRRWNPEFHDACDEQTAQVLLVWFFLCIGLTYARILNVANIAHGAGFGFGVLYAAAIWSPRHAERWRVAAVAASLVVLATLVACPGHNGYEHVRRGGRLWWQRVTRTVALETEDRSPADRSPAGI